MAGSGYTLYLAKEDFKLSAAHFTVFPDGSAERLHGHDYQVRVEVFAPEMGPGGLVCDIASVKRTIRSACARLDEKTLLPEKSPALTIRPDGDGFEVGFAERRYRFPREDVALLPLENVTMECLARLFWDEVAPSLAGSPARELVVGVEETPGQGCRYAAPLR